MSSRFAGRMIGLLAVFAVPALAQTARPLLQGQHWMAVTGKPLAATAGALIFERGGNAVDAACAMLGATATLWDVLGWGGETQALIYNPDTGDVVGINALGVAPSGATPEFFREAGYAVPPEYGPLAAVTPGTPGGLLVMLAEYGRLSLAEVLAPAIQLADGYPMDAQTAASIERFREQLQAWPSSARVFLTGEEGAPPAAGALFRQPDLARTLRRLVAAEAQALATGADRKAAIYAAYDLFYRGELASEFAAGVAAAGGLITRDDLDRWQVHVEQPVTTEYRGVKVFKLTSWVQGPVLLQALNLLEPMALREMGFNSARYIHTLYQVMNLAYADRDFYYGDPYFPPEEPMAGLLSKRYADERRKLIDPERNDPLVRPGDPYRFQKGRNPFLELLERWTNAADGERGLMPPWQQAGVDQTHHEAQFLAGTTSIQAADADGWLVSVTPSGGWIPAVIAGTTGIGLSQRMQSFVLDPAENPYNVLAPGKRPRATLTPSIALRDGKPWMAFSVQGGDIQDQVLLQFFLARLEFGMNLQEAAEGPYFWSYQMRNSFGDHRAEPGKLLLNSATPPWIRQRLENMGYSLHFRERSSGPITAIEVDQVNGTLRGAASHFGEDYGIGW